MNNPHDQEELIVLVNPLIRQSKRVRRFASLRDYVVYLGEADYNVGHTIDLVSHNKAIYCKQFD